jgi:predicted amino acid dehydrogenase
MTDRDAAREQILTTAKLAYNLGARYIGLGALTASLSRGGLDVHEHYPVEIATGRFYTVINIAELVQHSLEALDIPVATACVTIVGAAGSIGAGVAQVLAYKGIRHLTLIDLTDKRADVDSVCKHINTEQQGMTMTVLDAMQEPFVADIIVTATNKPNALIQKKHVLPGTVIVDDAQPSDVAAELLEDPDYLVLEGGVVHSHDITIPFDMGLQQPGDIFSCLAELLIIAEGSVPISSPLGRELIIDQDLMKKLQRRAVRLQFTAGDFQNQHKLYTKEEVARVRDTRAARV